MLAYLLAYMRRVDFWNMAVIRKIMTQTESWASFGINVVQKSRHDRQFCLWQTPELTTLHWHLIDRSILLAISLLNWKYQMILCMLSEKISAVVKIFFFHVRKWIYGISIFELFLKWFRRLWHDFWVLKSYNKLKIYFYRQSSNESKKFIEQKFSEVIPFYINYSATLINISVVQA